MRQWLTNLAIVGVLLFAVVMLAKQLDKIKPQQQIADFAYLPKNEELRSFAFGFEQEYAQVLWMISLQVFNKHLKGELTFDSLDQVYDYITDLDPHFQKVYSLGYLYINHVKSDPLAGIQLVEKAVKKNPEAPWAWHLLGLAYFLERQNLVATQTMSLQEATKKSWEAATKALELGAGRKARTLLKYLAARDPFLTGDITYWLDRHHQLGSHPTMKNLLEKRLRNYIVDLHLNFYQQELHNYKQQHGHWPESLDKLGIVLQEPTDKQLQQMIYEMKKILQRVEDLQKRQEYLVKYILNTPLSKKGHPYSYNPENGKIQSSLSQTNQSQSNQ